MKHLFQQGIDSKAPVLLLLHGTGGTERDLLPLAGIISPQSSVLSLRGGVLENGMPRFFRRLAEGIFDEEDLVLRTKELNDFLDEAASTYSFDRSNILAIGYSNGANIAGSLLLHYSRPLRGAILHHPMVPRRGLSLPDMTDLPVFIGAGQKDTICPPEETEELEQLLTGAGSKVTVHWTPSGHQLTQGEIDAASAWYQHHF